MISFFWGSNIQRRDLLFRRFSSRLYWLYINEPAQHPGFLVRQNLDGILAINEEAWQLYAKFLVHVRALRVETALMWLALW